MPVVTRRRGFTIKIADMLLAEKLANRIDFVPYNVARELIATAHFQIQGRNSVGTKGNWGLWIRTCLFTDGMPLNDGLTWQDNHWKWKSADSIEAANSILRCFDVSVDQVFDKYGMPANGEKYSKTLVEIIRDIAPHLA